MIWGAVAVELVVVLGLVLFVESPQHREQDPDQGLQQLDLFYLDELAPGPVTSLLQSGRVNVVVVCESCTGPKLSDAHVAVSNDVGVAEALALRRADGRIGPGYAIVDRRGRLRYRTFDRAVDDHRKEIEILVGASP